MVPGEVGDPGHVDAAPAELVFGALAEQGASDPVWSHESETCASVYCHGATLGGGSNKAPVWTVVDETQAACGTCHGYPPPPPHTTYSQCQLCHPGTVGADGALDVAGGLHIDGVVQYETACNACHGSASNPAPPLAYGGATDTSEVGVGAHQAHVVAGTLAQPVPCATCHAVPAAVTDAEHLDAAPADVQLSGLASAGGATPTWSHATETCSSVYCHGATLSGGSNNAPTWTVVDGSQAACGTCHGAPPAAPHPQLDTCQLCHDETVSPDGTIDLAGGKHINGQLEVPTSCGGCHGSEANPAPPLATTGASDTTDIRVGAHQAHVTGGALAQPFTCEACHDVPTSLLDPDHIDPSPAEVSFSELAAQDADPIWSPGAETCSSVYCHGATLAGGSNTSPTWTQVDGSQAACGTCHGAPPPPPHPAVSECRLCHSETVLADGSIDVAGGRHVDGIVQVPTSCSGCHGSAESPAPPVATTGASDTADVRVGAHQAHVTGGLLAQAVDCAACHLVPSEVGSAGHLDAAPAEVLFGALADLGAADASWSHAGETCSSVYCHGATLAGGSNTSPSWTQVDGTQAACGTCHGAPPPPPHPAGSACQTCHPETVAANGSIDVAGGKHIDGVVQVPTSCTLCHGSEQNAAPPAATTGATDTADVRVGAHQSHVVTGDLSQAFDCVVCHVVPGSVTDAGHLGASPAEVTFDAFAGIGDAEPVWSHEAATCVSVYCHGATLQGGSNKEPTWTTVDGSQAACGTCHGAPPPPPHPAYELCQACHSDTVAPDGSIDVAGGKHIDGELQVGPVTCGDCHGVPPATGSHLVHFGADVTDATYGGTGSAATVLPDGTAYAFDCGTCHPTDPSHHENGAFNEGGGWAEVALDPEAAPPGSLRSLNPPTAAYVPGAAIEFDAFGMPYTEGTCSDVYCHSALEHTAPAPVPLPGADFPFAGYPLEYPAIDNSAERVYRSPTWGTALSCDGCHGFPPRTWCEPDADGVCQVVDAGAGDSHSWIDSDGFESLHGWSHGFDPIACSSCHYDTVVEPGERSRDSTPPALEWSLYEPVPIADFKNHVDGGPDVAFDPDPVEIKPGSFLDLSASDYDPTGRACSDVSCHKAEIDVSWGEPYRWWNMPECNQCHHY